MKVNGYQLREALRRWTTKLEVLKARFEENIWQFPGEQKNLPMAAADWRQAIDNVALVQCLQQQFNAQVMLQVAGKPMTLANAVKLVGMLGQFEAAWRKATFKKKERYGLDTEQSRSKDNEYAVKSMTQEEIEKNADELGAYAASLRAAIAYGNSQEIDVGAVAEGVL